MSTNAQNKNMSTIEVASINMLESFNMLITEFLEKSTKKSQKLLNKWNSDDQQAKVKQMFIEEVKKTIPKLKLSKKSKKAPKDKNAPKKPCSSYILYSKDYRKEAKKILINEGEKSPKASLVTKKLGEMWRELTAASKMKGNKKNIKKAKSILKKYNEKANKDKERYEKEMKTYTPSDDFKAEMEEWKANGGAIKKNKQGKPLKPKDPEAPKKPLTSYIRYTKKYRDSVKEEMDDDVKTTDITRRLGEKWKQLSDDEKKPFIEEYNEDKKEYDTLMIEYEPSEEYKKQLAAYEEALASWKENNPDKVKSKKTDKVKSKKTRKRAKTSKKKKDHKAPKKPKNAYIIFCQENRQLIKEENEEWSGSDVTKELSKQWKNIDPTDKQKYTKKADIDKERYRKEMENYDPPHDDVINAPSPKRNRQEVKQSSDSGDDGDDSGDDILVEELAETSEKKKKEEAKKKKEEAKKKKEEAKKKKEEEKKKKEEAKTPVQQFNVDDLLSESESDSDSD